MSDPKTTGDKQINCPTCQKIVFWIKKNTYRPFCSKKCQLIDFGDWANERNTIPMEDSPDDFKLDELDVNYPVDSASFSPPR